MMIDFSYGTSHDLFLFCRSALLLYGCMDKCLYHKEQPTSCINSNQCSTVIFELVLLRDGRT